jgi:hypothetical protein
MEMIVAAPAVVETLELARRMMITALKPRCGNNELHKEGNAEAETKQRELKRAKRAKRNAMERDRKKRKQVKAKQGTQRLEEGVVIADQGDESEKNAGHGASNGAGVGLAQAHSKMRSKQNGSGFPVSACKPLIVRF